MLVRREQLINKLHQLGFHYKNQAPRVLIYARGKDRCMVPRRDLLDEKVVRSLLVQQHCTHQEIDDFLRQCSC